MVFYQAIPAPAEDIEIDTPPTAAPKAVESVNKASETKFQTIKKKIDDKILKTTGNPTTKSLTGLSKKERDEILSKTGAGYYGTLPKIEREFEYIKQTSKKTSLENKYKDTLIDEMNLQKTPDDDLFLDVILKKEKATAYTKDILRFIPLLERFKACIEKNCDIQRFNANVSTLDLYARRLEKDHLNTPDSMSETYFLIQNVSYLAKLQGNLKFEANYYTQYMPLTNTIYSKENIFQKDLELINEIDKTIFALNQLK